MNFSVQLTSSFLNQNPILGNGATHSEEVFFSKLNQSPWACPEANMT